MGLRIVYGRAGSGKTSFCLEEMKKQLYAGGQQPLVLIIPEQFSLQAEKNLAKTAGSAGVYRAEVLSFRRLAYRVFGEVGGITRKHLNTAGKSMLLFKIMDSLGSDLKIFSKAAAKKGFTQTLSDAITEFKRYDITPDKLNDAASGLAEGLPLRDKLADLALIYGEFEKLLHQNYLDAEDDLSELVKKLDQSEQFNDAQIWIDEFSGFTPQEYKVIEKLLKKTCRVTVCLCTDCLSNEAADSAPMVFAPVRNTAVKLQRLAAGVNAEIEKPVWIGGNGASVRFCDSMELGHLERNYFKYPYKKFAEPARDIHLVSSANLYSEVEDAARDIIRLCREKGFRYRDIAVTMRNPDSYRSIVKSVFSRYGIPFFLDGKRNIDSHPLITLIMSALEIFTSNWSYEAVFRYARTGLAGLDREQMDQLENYVLANGIRGNTWLRQTDWEYPIGAASRSDEPSRRDVDGLAAVNAARRQLAVPLESFRVKTKGGAKAVDFCTALFELLIEIGADRKVEEISGRFETEGLLDKAAENRQVWNIVMDVFSQIVEVLGEEKMGTERFADILSAGFAGHKIGLIPPAMDQVLAGSIERARSHEIKALYILGANEGVLPGTKGSDGLLSDQDRDSLDRLGIELAGNTASRCLEERFMIYMALATPSRYLWLSYPAADREGKALRPSRLLSEIRRILPNVWEQSTILGTSGLGLSEREKGGAAVPNRVEQAAAKYGSAAQDGLKQGMEAAELSVHNASVAEAEALSVHNASAQEADEISAYNASVVKAEAAETGTDENAAPCLEAPAPAAPGPTFDELAVQLRRCYDGEKIHEGWKEIYHWFSERENWKEKCSDIIKGLDYTNQTGRISADRAGKLFGKPVFTSVSRMEAYASCPFSYFVKYGLRAKERRMFTFEPVDAGTFMHHIIDEFSRLLVKQNVSWRGLDRQWCSSRISELVDGQLAANAGSILSSSKRYTYMSGRLKRTVARAVMLISRHIEKSSFEPTGYEVEFGDKGRYPPIRIELPNGECIKMTGRIDRIDSLTNADGTYLRIIDYKSGDRALKLADVYYGLQLQLVTYLDAVLGEERVGDQCCQAAGILYFRLDDPLIRCDRGSTEEEIEKAILRELRMKGLVLADVKLVREMDSQLEGDSLIIPARINKDGSLGRSSAATREQFDVLRGYVRGILASIGNGIVDGDITISPYKKQMLTACTYCSFSPVCQFDTSIRNNKYRYLSNIKDDEVWRLMRVKTEAEAEAALAAAGETEETEGGAAAGAGDEEALEVTAGETKGAASEAGTETRNAAARGVAVRADTGVSSAAAIGVDARAGNTAVDGAAAGKDTGARNTAASTDTGVSSAAARGATGDSIDGNYPTGKTDSGTGRSE